MLLTAIERAEAKVEVVAPTPNIGSSVEVAKLQVFDKTAGKVFGVFDTIQIIYKNKNKERFSEGANSIDTILHIGKISGCMEEECIGGFRVRKFEYEIVENF